MSKKTEYTNIAPNNIKELEIKCDEYTGYIDSKGNPIYDNDVLVNNELKEDAFVIKQAEKVVVLLRNSVIDILDNNKSSKWIIDGTIYDLDKKYVEQRYAFHSRHENDKSSIESYSTDITFHSIYTSNIIIDEYLDEIKSANVLLLPNGACLNDKKEYIFPEIVRDFYNYLKNYEENNIIKADIVADDDKLLIQEFHSELIIIPWMIIDKYVLPVVLSVIANFITDIKKRYNKEKDDVDIDAEMIISTKKSKRSLKIHYRGKMDGLNKIEDMLKDWSDEDE